MSIEAEKKRLTNFLAEQTAAHEAAKKRAREHCELRHRRLLKTLEDHVVIHIAGLEAQPAALEAPDAHA